MIGFYGLLAENKARTEVLPLPITRARPTHWSADIRANTWYRLSIAEILIS